MSLFNKNHGIIRKVSHDKTHISIRLPRGGFIEANNEGFEVGDVVCFIIGPAGNVAKVMPKYAADLLVEIANSPLLQAALQNEEVSDEHNQGSNDVEQDSPDCRPSAEECIDLYGGKHRDHVERWEDQPGNEFDNDNRNWPYS